MNVRNCFNVSEVTRAISVSPTKCSGPKENSANIECSQSNQLAEATMTAECGLNEVNELQCQVQQSITVPHSANSTMHRISPPRACILRPTAVSNKPVEQVTKSSSTQALQCPVPLVHTRPVNSDPALATKHVERTTAVSAASTGSSVTFADIIKSSERQKEAEWIKVSYKNKNKFIGSKGQGYTDLNGSFKAAEIKIPFYIYNVDKGALINDIKKHIYDKTKVTVELTRIKMKQAKQYEAYKFDIPRHKLPSFMDVNMWPEGIAFRRYIYFGKRSTGVAQVTRK